MIEVKDFFGDNLGIGDMVVHFGGDTPKKATIEAVHVDKYETRLTLRVDRTNRWYGGRVSVRPRFCIRVK